MKQNAVEISNLSKMYTIDGQKVRSLGEAIKQRTRRKKLPKNQIWPLKNISLEVPQGETVGILGRNGAGKSTLLKILSRITTPTEGYSRTNGRVGSLLEVGTGFSRELTGRENVYLNGIILGMSRGEIHKRFDQIIEFAAVGRFVDTPLKHYSSGMQMRLAFSVAAHLAADILIIDEVLAVGDSEFQHKCMTKMNELEKSGRTILLVSHNMSAIKQLCTRSIFLEDGSIKDDGPTKQVVERYIGTSRTNSFRRKPKQNQLFSLVGANINDLDEEISIKSEDPFSITLTGELATTSKQFVLSAYLLTESGQHVFEEFLPDNELPETMHPGQYKFRFEIPAVLAPGVYRLGYWAQLLDEPWDVWEDDIISFEISSASRPADGRILDLRPVWKVEEVASR